jgi:hypothetical protein
MDESLTYFPPVSTMPSLEPGQMPGPLARQDGLAHKRPFLAGPSSRASSRFGCPGNNSRRIAGRALFDQAFSRQGPIPTELRCARNNPSGCSATSRSPTSAPPPATPMGYNARTFGIGKGQPLRGNDALPGGARGTAFTPQLFPCLFSGLPCPARGPRSHPLSTKIPLAPGDRCM